ncbi:MAG: endolytic transglycosylase MltG [Rhodospirillales bacterium]|nr:endolytic transglycosylase MltG [Rhodospirillales bacterium]MCB9979595.1 endolytic transglycosylase MltG [Rhodospirillales bacterium]
MRVLTTIFTLVIVLSGVLGVVAVIGLKSFSAPGPLEADTTIVIENGLSAAAIAEQLKTDSVIASPFLFKTALKIFGHSPLKAGEYSFEKNIPLIAVIEKLEEGKSISRSFTIPEGLTSYEIVQILQETPFLEGEITTLPPEGSLLPETYSYQRGDLRQLKIDLMQSNLQKTLQEAWDHRAENLPLNSKEEALILASIIEKETGKPEERTRIAGVFINRLRKGMPLQTDPTVIYALTNGKPDKSGKGPLGRRLLKKDLEIDSPYNTYKYTGLPPTPIANPGKDSLFAAVQPEETGDLFFVADGTGGHLFAKTLKEHNDNVANWRKIRKEKDRAQNLLQPPEPSESGDSPLFESF